MPARRREATATDVEALLAFRNDRDVNRFMRRTSVDADILRREWLAVPHSQTDFSCVAERDGTVVAVGFLDVVDGTGQPGMPVRTEAVIGYIVDPAFWRQCVASDLVVGLLDAAFGPLGLRVTAGCTAGNVESVRALEKAGMRREMHGVADFWHAELGWVDGYVYAMLAAEWDARSTPV